MPRRLRTRTSCAPATSDFGLLGDVSNAPGPGWLRRIADLCIAVSLTLFILVLVSLWTRPSPTQVSARADLPVIDTASATAVMSNGAAARPVMDMAFAPLPLSMAEGASMDYVLPPGQSLQDMATLPAAIRLTEMNLIAVIRQNDTRIALVRLPDGRILRVRQGDRLQDSVVAGMDDRALYLMTADMTAKVLLLGL